LKYERKSFFKFAQGLIMVNIAGLNVSIVEILFEKDLNQDSYFLRSRTQAG
jgi:hypothetical protein